jgi:fatty acid desaturase
MPHRATDPSPDQRFSRGLLVQTVGIHLALMAGSLAVWTSEMPGRWAVLAVLVVAQGLWLDRMYITAHEAIHKKLYPSSPRLNDFWGTALLMPVAAPFTIYRRIHYFHHGHNRRDHHTANLDTFVVRGQVSPLRRAYYRAVWIFYVFLGGFFIHSLVSVLLFLVVPTEPATRISPVFKHWPMDKRLRSWGELGLGIGYHAAVVMLFGGAGWAVALGLPLAVFAWVWSLLLYVYHYDTSVGPDVRHNVRSLPRQRFFSWLLLNFNEHATHHDDPTIPWHQLPERRHELPAAYHQNQKVHSIWQAIWQQRKGPLLENMAEVGEFSVELRLGRR